MSNEIGALLARARRRSHQDGDVRALLALIHDLDQQIKELAHELHSSRATGLRLKVRLGQCQFTSTLAKPTAEHQQ